MVGWLVVWHASGRGAHVMIPGTRHSGRCVVGVHLGAGCPCMNSIQWGPRCPCVQFISCQRAAPVDHTVRCGRRCHGVASSALPWLAHHHQQHTTFVFCWASHDTCGTYIILKLWAQPQLQLRRLDREGTALPVVRRMHLGLRAREVRACNL